MNKEHLVNEIIKVEKIDPDGKRFERVSRCVAKNDIGSLEVTFDYNSELITLKEGQNISFEIMKTPAEFDYQAQNFSSYSYVMLGKFYKVESNDKDILTIYVSFGGLLMQLILKGKSFDTPISSMVCLAIKVHQ